MTCSLPPVGLVIALRQGANEYVDMRWTLEKSPPVRASWVIADALREGFLISQFRAEALIAVSTWRRRLDEWAHLHPELSFPK